MRFALSWSNRLLSDAITCISIASSTVKTSTLVSPTGVLPVLVVVLVVLDSTFLPILSWKYAILQILSVPLPPSGPPQREGKG